jgi:hypothetical protein
MTRPHTSRVSTHPDNTRVAQMGVVRMTRAIPDMSPSRLQPEGDTALKANVCMGRCGHCDVHPCQLHATF